MSAFAHLAIMEAGDSSRASMIVSGGHVIREQTRPREASAMGMVACAARGVQPRKVPVARFAVLERALAVLLGGDVDEGQAPLVFGDQVDRGPLGRGPARVEDLVALVLAEAGCRPDCLLLKIVVAHDDLRNVSAGPFGLPCDPEAAQVPAKGKEESENPAKGLSFAQQKFFAPCPRRRVLCERGGAKGGEGGPAGRRGLRNEFGVWLGLLESRRK